MNQQVEDALGGFEPTPDNIKCAVQILTHQAALSSAEYAMLLRPKGEPQPQAERRVFARKHGQDKPFHHVDRRRG